MLRRSLYCLAVLLLAPGGLLAAELVDGIAAQVGSDIVLVSEVEHLAGPVALRMEEAGIDSSEIGKMRADVLDRLIERRLVQQVVRRAELEATDAEVDSAILGIAEENGLELDSVVASVEAQGMSFEQYRQRIRAEIEQLKVINGMVRSRVFVEEDDVRALYDAEYSGQPAGGEEVNLRHILVTFPEAADAGARADACTAVRGGLARIRAGESFEDVAGGISEVNPGGGGSLGWMHAGSLASWMEPVRTLPPGGSSEVIETPFGCNLLQLVERREWKPVSFEEARGHLRNRLFDAETQKEYVEFIEKLRVQTYIERKGLYASASGPLAPEPPGREEGTFLVE